MKNYKLPIAVVTTALLSMLISVTGFYFLIHKPMQNYYLDELIVAQDEINQEKLKNLEYMIETDIETKIDDCLEKVKTSASERWNESCKTYDREIYEDGSCSLPGNIATYYDQQAKEQKEFCLKRYRE